MEVVVASFVSAGAPLRYPPAESQRAPYLYRSSDTSYAELLVYTPGGAPTHWRSRYSQSWSWESRVTGEVWLNSATTSPTFDRRYALATLSLQGSWEEI
jgi:hypothetical protein